jgi:hypothetical protein
MTKTKKNKAFYKCFYPTYITDILNLRSSVIAFESQGAQNTLNQTCYPSFFDGVIKCATPEIIAWLPKPWSIVVNPLLSLTHAICHFCANLRRLFKSAFPNDTNLNLQLNITYSFPHFRHILLER